MIRLKANFVADWISKLRYALIWEQGWPTIEVTALPDGHVPGRFFDAQRRRIACTPRSIACADDFACPQDAAAGWAMFQREVQGGQDLNRRLSKRHASIKNPDGMLAEWGIHHFHLGIAADSSDPNYVERGDPLVYAIIRPSIVYVINILGHRNWENEKLLESIHRNWPDLIAPYQVHNVTADRLSSQSRSERRRANVNTFTIAADGTVYMPLSGGVMANGVSAEAIREGDRWILAIEEFQSKLEEKISNILPTLMKQGYNGEEEIEAKLTSFDETVASVYFPKYLTNANLIIVREVPN